MEKQPFENLCVLFCFLFKSLDAVMKKIPKESETIS